MPNSKYKKINSSKVFNNIAEVRDDYCKNLREKYLTRIQACNKCVLSKVASVHHTSCYAYVDINPEMASLLMGVKKISEVPSLADKKKLEEAIIHLEESIKNKTDWCEECKEEHINLLNWLKELKELREKVKDR